MRATVRRSAKQRQTRQTLTLSKAASCGPLHVILNLFSLMIFTFTISVFHRQTSSQTPTSWFSIILSTITNKSHIHGPCYFSQLHVEFDSCFTMFQFQVSQFSSFVVFGALVNQRVFFLVVCNHNCLIVSLHCTKSHYFLKKIDPIVILNNRFECLCSLALKLIHQQIVISIIL